MKPKKISRKASFRLMAVIAAIVGVASATLGISMVLRPYPPQPTEVAASCLGLAGMSMLMAVLATFIVIFTWQEAKFCSSEQKKEANK